MKGVSLTFKPDKFHVILVPDVLSDEWINENRTFSHFVSFCR